LQNILKILKNNGSFFIKDLTNGGQMVYNEIGKRRKERKR